MLCASLSYSASPDDSFAAHRAEFQQAYGRLALGAAIPGDTPTLRSYVLYPYLQAARLSEALRSAGADTPTIVDEQIADFVRSHESEPVAQDLRRSWLLSLAARGRWQEFLVFHRDPIDGAALRCHRFTARIELGRTEGLGVEVARTWLTPRSLPDCDRAFAWLRSIGALDDALIEQRARLALEGGNAAFARQIMAPLPAARAAPLQQWAALLENPRRAIDALIAAPQSAVERGALLAGWTQLARNDRTAAKLRFASLQRARLDRRTASPFALALALALAWDRDTDALKFFARVEPADFDDPAREWQARAALWARDWKQAASSIAAMTESNRRTARWRYWAARVAALQGDTENARQAYESILAEDNYYSAMAAARLERAIAPHPQPLQPDAQLASIENLPAFVRARELRLSGLVTNAQAEWRAGQESLQPPARAQSIRLAARWGWYDQAVATATAERLFNDYALLYPRPYDTAVGIAAQISGVSADVIYSVIRQESLYRSDAVSTADARGLMQLLPETARRTARQWKQPVPSDAALFEPSVNVVLGAAHLKDLLDRYGNELPLALASYNAGPGAVQRWLPAGAMDPDIWIENIPYNETRTYVQRILWHKVVFAWLRSAQAQDTQQLIAR
ncbi:MAG: transglycosylase SLT domain-containing protein [Steroidobacteraceae bacterium]